MYKAWAKQKGFTIVELLIVIVVIGILAAISIVAYSGIQQRARDARRTSDISAIKAGLELYKVDNGSYPGVCAGGNDSGCLASDLASALVPKYMPAIPLDPQYSAKSYSYVRAAIASDSYGILIDYESKPHCKTGNNVNPNWWGSPGVPPIC